MRKFFYGFGIVTAVLAVVVAIGIFFVARDGNALDAESKAYVEESVTAISAHWDKKELEQRATPELKQKLSPAEVDTLFDALSTGLGPLIEYRGAKGQATVLATIGSGTVRSANYVASARYQKGEAEIRIGLLKVDDRWMIQGFYVNSNALLANLAGRKS